MFAFQHTVFHLPIWASFASPETSKRPNCGLEVHVEDPHPVDAGLEVVGELRGFAQAPGLVPQLCTQVLLRTQLPSGSLLFEGAFCCKKRGGSVLGPSRKAGKLLQHSLQLKGAWWLKQRNQFFLFRDCSRFLKNTAKRTTKSWAAATPSP